jgi:CxxC motif-containing protein (DUF1111 family)
MLLGPHNPQGEPIPPGCDTVADPEDVDDAGVVNAGVDAFTNFMRFLAPAPRRPVTAQVERGEQLFSDVPPDGIGCASCHVPMMMTGPNSVGALNNQPVNLFSDLLLHDMGLGLADGIKQGIAEENEFRTAPLWGLSRRTRFMHDGRSSTIQDAILRHGGQALTARDKFVGLSSDDRNALLAFLGSL